MKVLFLETTENLHRFSKVIAKTHSITFPKQ